METTNRDVIVDVTKGFPTLVDAINHLNAPPLRGDKLERLMEFSLAARGFHTIALTAPNTRSGMCLMNIEPVVKYFLSLGYVTERMCFEENEAFHSTSRSINHKNGEYSDMTSGKFVYFDSTTNLPEVMVDISCRVTNCKPYYLVKFSGREDLVMNAREHILNTYLTKRPVLPSVRTASVAPGGSLEYTENHEINKNPQLATKEFYPWMKLDTMQTDDVLREYINEFLNSNARVLILIGPPGTGKSTLIRTMITQHNVRATLAYTSAAVEHPSFIKDFTQSLQDEDDDSELEEDAKQHAVLIMEDSDESIRKREKGNRLMAEFLNTADGIASSRRAKMVFSTNLPNTMDIDPALMRPGRCFDVLPFRTLTADEAIAARRSVNLPEREFDPNTKYSLSEALNNPSIHATPELIKPRFGF